MNIKPIFVQPPPPTINATYDPETRTMRVFVVGGETKELNAAAFHDLKEAMARVALVAISPSKEGP